MKIEITDELYNQLAKSLKERYIFDDVAKHVELLIKDDMKELYGKASDTDKLTGLKSKNKLCEDVYQGICYNENLFITKYLCVDIDNFKKYLDYEGLIEGDELLKRIVKKLKETFPTQNIYRFGGDEFIIELGDIIYQPIEFNENIEIKHSIVEIKIQKNSKRNRHIKRAILYYLDRGIVESTINGNVLKYSYPE